MSTKENKSPLLSQHLEMIGHVLPLLTIVFFATYYYLTSKFADLQTFIILQNKVVQVEKDISLLQREDLNQSTKLELIERLEARVRECERKLNLLVTKDDRPVPSDTSLEIKAEIKIIKDLIESLKHDIKENPH